MKENLIAVLTKALDYCNSDPHRKADTIGDPMTTRELIEGAARAGSESEQELFARVLAGEFENPGTTQKRLVATIKELDKSEAQLFIDSMETAVNGVFYCHDIKETPSFQDLECLHEAGLLTTPHRGFGGSFFHPTAEVTQMPGTYDLIPMFAWAASIPMKQLVLEEVHRLSLMGHQLRKCLKRGPSVATTKSLVESLAAKNVDVYLCYPVTQEELIGRPLATKIAGQPNHLAFRCRRAQQVLAEMENPEDNQTKETE